MGEEQKDSKGIVLKHLETEIKIKNLDDTLEKLERIKSLMCEISDLSKTLFG